MSPAPQLKINSLIEQHSALIAEYTQTFQLDSVKCKRLEHEFSELANIPELAVDSYIALAALYSLKRKYSDATRYFSKVRQLGFWNNSTSLQLAVCSIWCAEIMAAAQEIKDLPTEGSPEYLRQLRSVCARVGLFKMAVECTDALAKLASEENPRDLRLSEEVAIAAEVVAYSGIDPQEVIERIHLAHTVVAQHSPDPIVVYDMSATFEGGTLYEFPLILTREKLVELEWKFAEAAVDRFETFIPGVISFGCATARPSLFEKNLEV